LRRSTIMRLRTVAKDGAIRALAESKPGVQQARQDLELEAARAEAARLGRGGPGTVHLARSGGRLSQVVDAADDYEVRAVVGGPVQVARPRGEAGDPLQPDGVVAEGDPAWLRAGEPERHGDPSGGGS
jgi:hypothetical protein